MRKTCYIVEDAVGFAVFTEKTRAEDMIRSIILDKMAELNFALKAFDEFVSGQRAQVSFRPVLEELVVLAGKKDSTVQGLLLAWNAVFTKDFLRFAEAELYGNSLPETPQITTQM